MKPGRNRSDAHWHDLVTAVVAIQGSRPVRPPAAMFTNIERRLGFVPARAGWLRVPVALGGLAASLVFALGWLAWRANAPEGQGAAFANSVATAATGAEPYSPPAADSASGPSAHAAAPAVSKSGATIASARANGAAAPKSANVSPVSPQQARQEVAGTAFQSGTLSVQSGNVKAGGAALGSVTTLAASGRISPIKEPIDLKSDYYVAGMIAAAMQNPVSANPFEATLQPEEWSDWVAGYELGSEIPPAEALALGASWKWSDPVTVSLVTGTPVDEVASSGVKWSDPAKVSSVTGMPVDEVSSSGATAASIAIEEPKVGAASRVSDGNSTAQGVSE